MASPGFNCCRRITPSILARAVWRNAGPITETYPIEEWAKRALNPRPIQGAGIPAARPTGFSL
jgi:hypothetical protein